MASVHTVGKGVITMLPMPRFTMQVCAALTLGLSAAAMAADPLPDAAASDLARLGWMVGAPPPPERFAIDDRVNHDKYGLGVVIGVEEEVAVLVDFRPRQERITAPYDKLTKL